MSFKYLHAMVRVTDIEASLDFYVGKLGLKQLNRHDDERGRFTLIFLAAEGDKPQIELTHNWDPDPQPLDTGRSFGHLAYLTDDIYAKCQELVDRGVTLNRPPRDGRLAFVKSPDNISIELIQRGGGLEPAEPWASMPNVGSW